MSQVFSYQIFSNVQSVEDALGNIKLMAENANWTIDKDDIADNQELYLHNLGNGNQNLYFSLKGVADYWGTYRIITYGNTGFDDTLAVDSQPGKYTVNSLTNTYTAKNLLIAFPATQYVLVNGTTLISIFDTTITVYLKGDNRVLPHLIIGTLDLYNTSSTEGNIALTSNAVTYYGTEEYIDSLTDNYFHPYALYYYKTFAIGGVLYNGENQISTIKSSIMKGSIIAYISATVVYYTYPRYDAMIKYNTTTSRTTLIKPQIYIPETTDTDSYFYPIGELPYYACIAYPYSKAGDIIMAGTRKFMVFPLLNYTDATGVAFEVTD